MAISFRQRRLVLLLLSTLACLLQSSYASCPPSSLRGQPPSEINIGVLVWADTDEVLLTRPITSYSHISPTSPGFQTAGTSVLQPFYLGIDFYQRLLANQTGGKIPILGGESSITLNIHYVNMGRVDWDHLNSGYPIDGYISAVYTATAPGGLFDVLAYNSSKLLGGNRTFTFFVAHPLLSTFVTPLLNRIEDQQTAILVHPFQTETDAFICDGLPLASSKTPDCTSPQYGRNRLLGARRFDTQFSAFPDLSYDAITTLDLYYTLGIKRIAIFREDIDRRNYPKDVLEKALEYAKDLNLNVVLTAALKVHDCVSQTKIGCPPNELLVSQNQVWPDNTTGQMWAKQLQDLDVEGVIIIALSGTGAGWSFAQLIRGMQEVDYTPKSLGWIGAFEKGLMEQYLPNGGLDMRYTTGEIVWHDKLRGAYFRPQETKTNFEPIQSNATHAGPQVFTDQFNDYYSPWCKVEKCVAPAVPGIAHPFWLPYGVTVPVIAFASMIQIQKMIEIAATDHVPSLLISATRVDVASVYERILFDRYGRLSKFDTVVTQYIASGDTTQTNILTPFNIGVQPVYPMPSWKERVFVPKWYSEKNEHVILAITTIAIAMVLIICAVVLFNIKHPVIRATTPSMALVISIGGLLALISNYFNTLHTNDAHCITQAWVLTTGITLMLSSLFIKTFRIWRIFETRKLAVVVIRDNHLFSAVGCFLCVDVLLNIIWQAGGGMKAHMVVIDEIRPGLNYMECDYSSNVATGIVYTQIIYKAAIVLCGIPLTWKVRNVPSDFNESTLLSLCIYNVLILSCFVVPLVGSGVGGRSTTMLIRAMAVVFLVLATMLLLYIPKLFLIITGKSDNLENRTQQLNTTNTPTTPTKMAAAGAGTGNNNNTSGFGSLETPKLKISPKNIVKTSSLKSNKIHPNVVVPSEEPSAATTPVAAGNAYLIRNNNFCEQA